MLPPPPRRSALTGLTLSGLSLAACGSASDHADVPHVAPSGSEHAAAALPTAAPSASEVTPQTPPLARTDPGINLQAEISARSVTSEHLAFQVFYSWTTEGQLAEIQKGEALLSRTVSKKHGISAFDDLVATEAARGRDVAKILWHEGFAKKRFAWPSPYAALRGEPPTNGTASLPPNQKEPSYGGVLLRIELKPDAWILDYDRGVVHALDGSRHTPEELAKNPERLAAVYHDGPGFREYVIVNEGMIGHVSGGASKGVTGAIASDIELLQALAAHLEDTPSDVGILALFQRSDMFTENFSSGDLRQRAKVLDTLRGAEHTELDKDVTTKFALGAPRAAIAPFCKLVRKETHASRAFRGSFAGPAVTTFSAICSDPDGLASTPACVAGQGTTPNDATCTPVPAFGQ